MWASTGTKNPEYSDVKYVEPLIGPETVNTMPLKTIEAYRDHGNPTPRLEEELEESPNVLARLAGLGIEIDQVTRQLEEEGVEKFNQTLRRPAEEHRKEKRRRRGFSEETIDLRSKDSGKKGDAEAGEDKGERSSRERG